MTESDAPYMVLRDVAEVSRRLAEAKGPEAVLLQIKIFTTHRARGIHPEMAEKIEAAFVQPGSDKALSMDVAERCARAVRSVAGLYEPEDVQALFAWMLGSEQSGPGFVVQVLRMVRDRLTDNAVGVLAEAVLGTLKEIETRDKALFEALSRVSPEHRAHVQWYLDDAVWAISEQDGETARGRLVHARKLARHILKVQGGSA